MTRAEIKTLANLLAKNSGSVTSAEQTTLFDSIYTDFWFTFGDRLAKVAPFLTTVGTGYEHDSVGTPLEVEDFMSTATVPKSLELVTRGSIQADIGRSTSVVSGTARKVAVWRKQDGSGVYTALLFPSPGNGVAFNALCRKELTALANDSATPDLPIQDHNTMAVLLAVATMNLNSEPIEDVQRVMATLDTRYQERFKYLMRQRGRKADEHSSEAGA